LGEQHVEVNATVRRRVRSEASDRLCKLTLGRDRTPAAGLVPGDGDVDEALQEVAFLGRSRPPLVFELFVRREVLPGADQFEAVFKS
jgi:hypothetical protein